MKKTLFLTCALALASFVGVSAQTWCRTVACGQGEAMTTEGGKAMHKGQTPLVKNAGAEGVRFTVIATAPNSEIKGGGPCFALGEMQILNEAGEAISYSVTSNADHNTMGGAGSDGQGFPALNDGVIEGGNYWHSTWSAQAPDAYHYLEFTFEEPVDAFQLVWYTRPGSDKNNPTVVGLTNPGVDFTEDMLYAEYEYSLGSKVADASELAGENKFFTFYVEGPTEYGADDEGNPYTGPGNVYVALSGYSTGNATEASPTNIIQLIAGNDLPACLIPYAYAEGDAVPKVIGMGGAVCLGLEIDGALSPPNLVQLLPNIHAVQDRIIRKQSIYPLGNRHGGIRGGAGIQGLRKFRIPPRPQDDIVKPVQLVKGKGRHAPAVRKRILYTHIKRVGGACILPNIGTHSFSPANSFWYYYNLRAGISQALPAFCLPRASARSRTACGPFDIRLTFALGYGIMGRILLHRTPAAGAFGR